MKRLLLASLLSIGLISCSSISKPPGWDVAARASYGRLLEYIDFGKVKDIDIFLQKSYAFVELVDDEVSNEKVLVLVDLPGTDQLIKKLKNEKISFEFYPSKNEYKNSPQKYPLVKYSDFLLDVKNQKISRILIRRNWEPSAFVYIDGRRANVYLGPDENLLETLTNNNVDIAVEPYK